MLHVIKGPYQVTWFFFCRSRVKKDLDNLLSEFSYVFVLCPLNLVQLTATTLPIKPKYSVINSAIPIS